MFLLGKLFFEVFERFFIKFGVSDFWVLFGLGKGIDFGVVDFGEKVLVVLIDLIIGVVEDIGFYVVYVNVNDVVVVGVRLKWFLIMIFLFEGFDERFLERIMDEIDREVKKFGVVIIGGYIEVIFGLDRLIVIGIMFGEVEREKFVRFDGVKFGDVIVMMKWVGLEGILIIVCEKREELIGVFGKDLVERVVLFIDYISVVFEVILVVDFGVNVMYDLMEGGIVNGFYEMVDLVGLGFRVFFDKIFIWDEMKVICRYYSLNLLVFVGFGFFFIVVSRDCVKVFVEIFFLRGINVVIIGEFLVEEKRVVVVNGEERFF